VTRYSDRNEEQEAEISYRMLPEKAETTLVTNFLDDSQIAGIRI
jgi:hypothetical protein